MKWLWMAATAVLAVSACRGPAVPAPGDVAPTQKHQIVLVNKELDPLLAPLLAQRKLFVSQVTANYTDDGRLSVKVNIQNDWSGELRVQLRTVFKDAQGFSTGDETPWKLVVIPRGSWVTHAEVSMNNKARDFNIEIRRFKD